MATTSEHHHYRVNLSSGRTFTSKLKSSLKETCFPDDPFHGLTGLSMPAKTWYAIKYFVPILDWAPKYTFSHLWADVLAGITIASLAIPQGISYAGLAKLPPVIGLYSTFVPPLVYAIFGSSKNLAVGTTTANSLLLASIIQNLVSPSENMELYTQLFFTAAFFTGIFQMALGFLRLGLLVDFISKPTVTGFMTGITILIILQQLKGMLGMKHFTTKTDVISVLRCVFENRHEWQWQSALLGVCFLSFLILTQYVRKRQPKLFYVSAVAPLMVVVMGGLFAFLIHGQHHGIPIVGDLKKGLNPISVSQLKFQSEYIGTVAKAGIITAFVGLAEGIAVGRSFGMMKNENIDGNQEMVAFGLMNLAGSFTSCYLTTGPFSKSAVNYQAGCKTPMSNVVMSLCIMFVLLFLAPLFKYTPLVALSAVIISAMLGLFKYKQIIELYKVDKFDFCICMAAFVGVVFCNLMIGLGLSVVLGIIRALLYVARPTTCKMGNINGGEIYCDVAQYPDAYPPHNMLILQVGSPIYFANSDYLRERIARWVEDELKTRNANEDDLLYVIIDISGVSSIDNTGIGMLREVHKYLERKGIKMALTNPRLQIVDKLRISGLIDLIGECWIFLSVGDAVNTCRYAFQQESKHNSDDKV
ncbi:hypothetical protein LUZ60_008502 [Juncus effusus]|nr:hypothetical protein LUZ60_008502 [Juncus effusus]